MRDVELVETDDAPTPAPEREPSFLDRVRRRPRWLAAGAALVVAVVGYQVVSDRRLRAQDEARAAALADVPFVLDRVDPRLPVFLRGTYSWDDAETPPEVFAYLGRGVPVGDVLVTGGPGEDVGEARVLGMDPSTADVVWETTFAPPEPEASQPDAWCMEPEPADATTVRCLVRWQLPPAVGERSDGLWSDVQAVVEVDGESGTVLRRTDVPTGATLGTGAWGLVVGTRDGARVTLDASEWDGTRRWTRTFDLSEVDEETYLSLTVSDDRVLLTDGPEYAGWVLAADDGATLTTLDGVSGGWGGATLLPDGGVVVADPALAGSEPTGDPAALLVRPDGTRVPLDGDHLEWVALDDGTLGDALLTGTAASSVVTRTRGGEPVPAEDADAGEGDGSVARLREADGSVRWEVPGLDVQMAMAVDGMVVVRTSDEVAAVDARTGRVRWRAATPGDGASMYAMLTDGRVILVARGAQLDALSYRGERLWSVHVQPAGEQHAVVPGPAPTPVPTDTATVPQEDVMWGASLDGRLTLRVMDPAGDRQEYVVFDKG